jgi:ribosome recycling factor
MIYDFAKFKKSLQENEDWFKREVAAVRTGRASLAILDSVRVESYGALLPVSQVAGLAIEDARALRITPYDMSQSKAIEKAITLAGLGVTVSTDEKGLRVSFPELTAERRAEVVKMAKSKLEDARKTLRAYRDGVVKDLQSKEKAGGVGKDDIFRLKNETQKFSDDAGRRLEDLFQKKEKEIMS